MHGRLKVRTTAEEKERKKKVEAVKLRFFRTCMAKILEKRENEQYDDEMMQITGQILLRNADIATLWNIRRQCLERKTNEWQESKNKVEVVKEDLEEMEENLQKVFGSELSFTEQCLMTNPKSYCCWHQRCWVLENCPKPDWNQEVMLCNKYLKLDERNFHTWDYRRYIVENAKVPKKNELDFCTEKIKVNLSNYSSWHHRSLLLPLLYPYDGDALPKRPMSEEKLKEELEMVMTAAFTDPNDSSAWFYQRWLLGQSNKEPFLCSFRCDKEKAVIAFTLPLEEMDRIQVSITWFEQDSTDKKSLQLNKWFSVANPKADTTWFTKLPKNFEFLESNSYHLEVTLPKKTFPKEKLNWSNNSLCYFVPPNQAFKYSQGVKDELQTQLESCNSLLEFEPDSKWTLLTSALLMREIDPLVYHEKSMANLQKLQQVDPLRIGYYKDLGSKWLLEKFFNDWLISEEYPSLINLISQKDLISLQYPQYFSIANHLQLSPELADSYRNRKLPKLFTNI